MTWFAQLPIRARITAAFAVVMAALLLGIGLTLYLAMNAALADEIDTGLRFRADALAPLRQHTVVEERLPALEEPREAFDQLLTAGGAVLRSTPGIPRAPLLPATEIRGLHGPTFFNRPLPGVQGQARLLAVPLTGVNAGHVLVVGASDADRTDALRQLLLVLALGGPMAIGLASYAGWRVAGWAMRPVERIRREASAITASGLDRRLEVPSTRDELRRLAETLNAMLQRLDEAVTSERRFLERASHELRTPLPALKAELDLAGSDRRSPAELSAAIASAAEETNRLTRLAEDLLIRARTHEGRLEVRREDVPLRELVDASVALFRPRALQRGQRISADAPTVVVRVDPMRVRQALDNLLDNALRHTTPGTEVHITASITAAELRLEVRDTGPGFSKSPASERQGLGLQIAEAVAVSHGGSLVTSDRPDGGAVIVLTFAGVTE